MVDSIRSASSALYHSLDPATPKPVEAAHVKGTERPDAVQSTHTVHATGKAAELKNASEHTKDNTTPPPAGPPGGTDSTGSSARAEKEGEHAEKQEGEQTTQDALKDPTSEVSRQVRELSDRDREVRAHEQAHLAAAGQYSTYGPNYNYQTGPDGRRYAIGGEVGIDTSVVADDPQATLAKMQVVQRAALAPAEPSAQDMRVAADASQKAAQARMEIMREQSVARSPESTSSDNTDGGADKEAIKGNDMAHTSKQAVDAYSETDATHGEMIDLAA